jgi:hypothetical protein
LKIFKILVVVSIHYLLNKLKRGLFEAILKIKNIKKKEKTCSFYVLKQTPNVTF